MIENTTDRDRVPASDAEPMPGASTASSTPLTLTIVLPAYNEAGRLGPALDELFGYLRRGGERARDGAPGAAGLPERIEVLVVDDGSEDRTAEEAELAGARVIRHPAIRGVGGACATPAQPPSTRLPGAPMARAA